MESLKIALVSDWYFPKIGGVAAHMHDLARYLGRRGHDVDIITNDLSTGKEGELRVEGIGLVKVPGRVVNGLGINAGVFAKNVSYLYPFLGRYDVVHGQHAFTPLSLKAASAARKLGKASLLTTHSVNFENSSALKGLAHMSFPYFKYYLRNPHRIVAVSKASREFIKRFTDVPVEVIYNGIDIKKFHNDWDRGSSRRDLELPGENLILYVGRLEPRKGVGVLISAMKHVEGTLLIAGTGSILPLLKEKAKRLGVLNRTRFLGHVEHSKLPKLYAASDVFVLPSLSEAFGIVLLEAMASGVPVIGTNVGGIPEIIDGCGILTRPGDPKELASAINSVLNNQNFARRLGKLGRRKAERIYSWDIIAKKVEALYREVVDEVAANG